MSIFLSVSWVCLETSLEESQCVTCLNMGFQCVVQVNSTRALKSYSWHQNGFLNVQAMKLTLERSLMSMMIHAIHCMTGIPLESTRSITTAVSMGSKMVRFVCLIQMYISQLCSIGYMDHIWCVFSLNFGICRLFTSTVRYFHNL